MIIDRISGIMVSILTSSTVDHGSGVGSNQRLWNWYLLLLL